MALPDYLKRTFGVAIVWGEPGGSGVTKSLSLNAMADGSARMGASADLGEAWDQDYYVQLLIETGAAPTAGRAADLYLACSHDGVTWPAGVTGSDGAWPSDGNEDEWSPQLGAPVVALVATNDGNTTQAQQPVIWRPTGRYAAPIVDNNLGQALRNVTPASNHASRVILVPIRILIQDTA